MSWLISPISPGAAGGGRERERGRGSANNGGEQHDAKVMQRYQYAATQLW